VPTVVQAQNEIAENQASAAAISNRDRILKEKEEKKRAQRNAHNQELERIRSENQKYN